jgi:hypothetical protein
VKKSYFMAARLKIHEREPWVVSETGRVAADVEAAEAAGVVWDPEEEPLPEKVSINNIGVVCLGSTPITLAFKRWKTEAVRRYNAWPALEKLVAELPERESDTDPCRFSCRLEQVRRVLRGDSR